MPFNPKSYRAGLVYPALRYVRAYIKSPELRNLLRVARQLRNQPRFTVGEVRILPELTLRYADTESFLSAYDEIFVNHIYQIDERAQPPFVIDAGANIGLASVYWSLRHPEVEGFAFEPDPKIFAILEENLRRCRSRIKPIMSALGSHEGNCSFQSQGADAGRIRSTKEPTLSPSIAMIEAKQIQLSSFIHRPIDLLKIDIEGSELDVLQEIRNCLFHVKRIFVECHCFRDERDFLPEVIAILRDEGFRMHYDVIASSYRGFELVAPDREIEVNMNIYGRRESSA